MGLKNDINSTELKNMIGSLQAVLSAKSDYPDWIKNIMVVTLDMCKEMVVDKYDELLTNRHEDHTWLRVGDEFFDIGGADNDDT